MGVFRTAVGTALVTVLAGCVAPVKNAADAGKNINVTTGAKDCVACTGIKTFESGSLGYETYAFKDSAGVNTGQTLFLAAKMGITNKTPREDGEYVATHFKDATNYAKTVVSEGYIFQNEFKESAFHHYLFYLAIHHNTNGPSDPYLVDGDNFIPMPPVKFQDFVSDRQCFNTGCVWDEDYVIPAPYLNKAIQSGSGLTVFFGKRENRQVASADGLNKTYQVFNNGAFLKIPSSYLRSFVDSVHSSLSQSN